MRICYEWSSFANQLTASAERLFELIDRFSQARVLIENYELPQAKPITEKLREKLISITENRDSQYSDWVEVISLVEWL